MRHLILILLVIGFSAEAKVDIQTQTALKKFAEVYRSAHSFKELFSKLPGAGARGAFFYVDVLQINLNAPLPKITKFLPEQGVIGFGGLDAELQDAARGKVKVNGRAYQWLFQETFVTNLTSMVKAYERKTSSLDRWTLLIPSADAQNRDFFPKDASSGTTDVANIADIAVDTAFEQPFWQAGWRGLKKVFLSSAVDAPLISEASAYGALAFGVYYAVNYAHAYVLGPSCDKQMNELMETMNKDHISLSGIDCKDIFRSTKSIEFWTPDRKRLSFSADWTNSTLSVSPDEVYLFNHSGLDSVVRDKKPGAKVIKEGDPDFANYQKNLEPYRKVLYLIGTYNSCYRCEDEFKKILSRDKPGEYVLPSDDTTGTPGTTGTGTKDTQ